MPLWSAFIAASFVFGNSAKDAFESIIFVFVTVRNFDIIVDISHSHFVPPQHPFDAGDRVLIGTENWVVQNVGLLVSTFVYVSIHGLHFSVLTVYIYIAIGMAQLFMPKTLCWLHSISQTFDEPVPPANHSVCDR